MTGDKKQESKMCWLCHNDYPKTEVRLYSRHKGEDGETWEEQYICASCDEACYEEEDWCYEEEDW